jgi:hypothetical protein
MNRLNNLNFEQFDFSILFQPGLYQIVNKKTGKIYYGESQNIAVRFSQHFSQLQAGTHWASELQKDWNKCESDIFIWQILEIGPEWNKIINRQIKEKKLIQASINNVYNKLPTPFLINTIPSSANPVLVHDKLYASVNEAAKTHNISVKKAIQLLEQNNNEWRYLNPEIAFKRRHKYEKVSKRVKIDDVIFISVSAAARFFDIHARTVKKRILSGNFPGWLWVDTETKKKINTNVQRKRQVNIEGQLFISIAEAAKIFNLHRDTIRARCLSKSNRFQHWQFL